MHTTHSQRPAVIGFIIRLVVFLLAFLVFVSTYFYLFVGGVPREKQINNGVYAALDKSQKPNKTTTVLVLGDSVAYQAYPPKEYNGPINSITTNQACSVVGQYMVLKNFLTHFEGDRDNLNVYLVYRPSSFRNNLDDRFIFNYFLKPFYREPWIDELTPEANAAIQKIPFYWLAKVKIVKESNWSPELRVVNQKNHFHMAPLSAQYVKKMQTLCVEQGVSFFVRCPFMSDRFNDSNFEEFREEVKDHGLNKLFLDYFQQIIWLDQKNFYDDVHLSPGARKSILKENFLNLR